MWRDTVLIVGIVLMIVGGCAANFLMTSQIFNPPLFTLCIVIAFIGMLMFLIMICYARWRGEE